jgi:hypothetical protein
MSVITWPGYRVSRMIWRKANQAAMFKSIFGSQSLTGSAPLTEVSITGVAESRAIARQIQATIDLLDGYKNQLALWNVELPAPAGTMRGTMTLSAAAAQGVSTLSITAGATQAGKTLLAGDCIGLGSGPTQQVVRVASDAVADGTGLISVSLNIPLRNAFALSAAVTWDKPAALFRLASIFQGMNFGIDGADAWSIDLREDWRS